jgi:hypothetical protein
MALLQLNCAGAAKKFSPGLETLAKVARWVVTEAQHGRVRLLHVKISAARRNPVTGAS